MNTEEFLQALSRTRDRFQWRLDLDTGWGAETRRRPRFHLRGYPKDGAESERPLDPLAAVCLLTHGRACKEGAWPEAAEVLGLDPVRASEIMAAADDRTWAGAENHREPVEYLQALRDQLIAAAGVEPRD